MTLAQLDPARRDETRFDPDGPAADRVLAAVLAPPPARRRVLLPAAAVAAACAAAAVGLSVSGSGGDALRPAAAFAAAVERTAASDSGLAHIHTVVRGPDGSVHLDARHNIRFSGDDSETTQLAGAGTPESGSALDGAVWRTVGGRVWLKQAGGDWRPMPDAAPRDPLADEARSIIGDRALADLIRNADGVARDGSTFRAVLDGDAIRSLPQAPFGIGGIRDLGRVALTMTLADDGRFAKLVVAYGGVTRTIAYEALDEPQDIPVP